MRFSVVPGSGADAGKLGAILFMPPGSKRPLPPLEVATAYETADFERFEYFGALLTGSKAILRLHLKNGTTLDLPCDEIEMKRLAIALCEAHGPAVVEHLKTRKWI